jgi:hypothetical protein
MFLSLPIVAFCEGLRVARKRIYRGLMKRPDRGSYWAARYLKWLIPWILYLAGQRHRIYYFDLHLGERISRGKGDVNVL